VVGRQRLERCEEARRAARIVDGDEAGRAGGGALADPQPLRVAGDRGMAAPCGGHPTPKPHVFFKAIVASSASLTDRASARAALIVSASCRLMFSPSPPWLIGSIIIWGV